MSYDPDDQDSEPAFSMEKHWFLLVTQNHKVVRQNTHTRFSRQKLRKKGRQGSIYRRISSHQNIYTVSVSLHTRWCLAILDLFWPPPAFSVLAHMYLLACEIPVSMQSFSLLRMSLPSETLGLHSDGRSWDLEAGLCLFSHLSLSCWCHCCPWWTEDRFIGLRFKWLKWLTFKNVYCAKLISDRTTKCSLYPQAQVVIGQHYL